MRSPPSPMASPVANLGLIAIWLVIFVGGATDIEFKLLFKYRFTQNARFSQFGFAEERFSWPGLASARRNGRAQAEDMSRGASDALRSF